MVDTIHEDTADLTAIARRIGSVACPEELFGPLDGSAADQCRQLSTTYRRLVAVVHPDRNRASDAATAHAAFVELTRLRDLAEAKIHAGTYGDRNALTIVRGRRRTYTVGAQFATGDLCDLYVCTSEAKERVVLKLAMSADDSDLVAAEAEVLRRLYPAREEEKGFYRYLPRLLEAVVLENDRTRRRANVLSLHDDHVSAAEALSAHPDGLDFRDVAWMTKRLLAALGFVHRKGVVHGAVLPPHLLVHPITHGARLVDWCYAQERGSRVRAINSAYRSLYAPEILRKEPVSAATDIYMAAATTVTLLGGDAAGRTLPDRVPGPVRRFFLTCLAPSPARRPDDAWKLHEELDELLARVVGKRRYRPLDVPSRARP
ncbi:Adenylate cyclase [Labilithrix luteola]|uniref:Adenylate cyclase n=1 Tax=Labilithrix luteola TaxID=1391654 RepID=A0A0K1PN16_9BACT|nr:molecular chaperone DnaJ [Labilithrix luteola]AKU94781.1 Adenylate cyclase [Labilithrix luteola]